MRSCCPVPEAMPALFVKELVPLMYANGIG